MSNDIITPATTLKSIWARSDSDAEIENLGLAERKVGNSARADLLVKEVAVIDARQNAIKAVENAKHTGDFAPIASAELQILNTEKVLSVTQEVYRRYFGTLPTS